MRIRYLYSGAVGNKREEIIMRCNLVVIAYWFNSLHGELREETGVILHLFSLNNLCFPLLVVF